MTKAIVLAAGQGTRLRPITDSKPKCLVELDGIPILNRQIASLRENKITDIHVVTGYRADQIEKLGFQSTRNNSYTKTNMVFSLFSALQFLEKCNEDLIISYGDIVYNPENLKALLQSKEDLSLMIDKSWKDLWSLRLEDPLEDAESLRLSADGYVTELGKKPNAYHEIEGQYTGLIKVRADKIRSLLSFYDSIDQSATFDGQTYENMYMTSFIQMLIDANWPVKAVLVDGGWLEIDTVEDLEVYEANSAPLRVVHGYRF